MDDVSVVIPNYNHGRFLSQCLESVINQSRPPLEILIGDGGSIDDSLQILDNYAASYPNLIHVYKFKRLTVNPTIEFLINASKGEYVSFIGADDYWDPKFLESCMKEIGESCVVYTDLFHVWPKKNTVWSVPDYDRELLFKTNYISLNAALIRRKCLDDISRKYGHILADNAGIPSDWELWQRMSLTCDFTHLAEPLVYFRKHRQQNSSRLQLQWDIYKIYSKSNNVTLSYLLKMVVGGTFISFLQLYNLHFLADFLMIPIHRKSSRK